MMILSPVLIPLDMMDLAAMKAVWMLVVVGACAYDP
jgi:hypothetical protein